jgi:TolA-binding protein
MWTGVAVPASQAQDPDLQSLMQKVQRLQRELNTLQRHVFQGGTAPTTSQGATSQGTATQGAATGAGEIGRPQAARLELRLSQFETELRNLTGQVEEQSFRLNQLNQKLERLEAGLDQRLQQPAPQSQTAARAPANPPSSAAAANPPVDDGSPRVIGQISQNDLQAAPVQQQAAVATPARAASVPAGTTPEAQYKHAHNLLNQANYDGAQLALQAFLDDHPDNRLAGNAMYWLGETYYVRKRYDEAAVVFAPWPRSALPRTPAAPSRCCSSAIPRRRPPFCSGPGASGRISAARERRGRAGAGALRISWPDGRAWPLRTGAPGGGRRLGRRR